MEDNLSRILIMFYIKYLDLAMQNSFPLNKKYLIVNADDFGLTEGVNQGILEGFQKGVITSASIMVTGDAFEDAVQKAKENPELAVGIHLTLVAGKSVLTSDQIPSLVDTKGSFYPGYKSFFYKLMGRKIRQLELEQELQAQIERFLDTGLKISHLDSHLHVHHHPALIPLIICLAQKYQIPYIRCSEEMPIRGKKVSFPRWIKAKGLNFVARSTREKILQAGLKTSSYFYGMSHSGHFIEEVWLTFLPQIKDGVTEVMCHPGYEDEALDRQGGDPTYQRKEELKSLTSPKIKEMILRFGIELTNYPKLGTLSAWQG